MEVKSVVCFLALVLLCLQRAADAVHYPTVTTSLGKIRGIRHSVGGKSVDVYYGIPFAQPPVGDLRFRPPIQVDPWHDTLEATEPPNCCMQAVDTLFGNFSGAMMWNANTDISEDCLYLNVWAPHQESSTSNKAVMIWIYGGGFFSGTSTIDIYDAKHLAVENDVIVVSMQYRVGALGFLTLDHPQAPGNAGMFDQRMAMEWVQRYIPAFGGNAGNITLFGESDGATSVGLHLLSPTSRGFFDRAILQSGAPSIKEATIPMDEAVRRTRKLAELVGCDPDFGKNEMLSCLRKVKASEFPKHEFTVIGRRIVPRPFVPVVDGNFLIESPEESLRLGRFKKIPLLLGTNSNEASYLLVYFDVEQFDRSVDSMINRSQFITLMNEMFRYYPSYPELQNDFGIEAILFHYTDWLDPDNQTMIRHNIEQAVGDYYFVCPVNELAQAYANAGESVYYYRFTHRMSNNPWGDWMGVLHGDEINFVFGGPLVESKGYTSLEKDLSRKMMRYWTNFAKTGDPNRYPGMPSLGEWPEYKTQQQMYLTLSLDVLDEADADRNIGIGPRIGQCAFWQHYLPVLVSGTADIHSVEKDWKLSYNDWKTRYIVDWKNQFDNFLKNYERRFQSCGGGP